MTKHQSQTRSSATFPCGVVIFIALLSGACQSGSGLNEDERNAESVAVSRIEALGGEVQRDLSLPGEPVVNVQLGRTAATDDDLEMLQALKQVRVINLSGSQITDRGLAELAEMTSIVELQLSQTQISDEGLEHLRGLSRLIGLHVRSTRVTQTGLQRLKEAVPGLIVQQPRR